jgi:uncharacterized sporulation protein YeaH/YhbH (DUF444 family)
VTASSGRQGGSGGGGGGQAGDSGGGDDDFVFHLSKEEFMQVFFDDLALPNLIRTTLAETPEYKTHRAGFSSDGTPNNLHVVRSMRGAIGRRMALGSESRRELHRLEALLEDLLAGSRSRSSASARSKLIERDIEALRARIGRIPFLDPIDLRYRSHVRTPVPTAKAVMFCVMDVSGSMDEARKDLAKRFFILLYLFLTRHYERIDLVFIRHHTQAQEVDEHEFFHATETGGTVVSSALVLMEEIIQRSLPARRVEHLRRPRQRWRQLAHRQPALPRIAGAENPAAVPLFRLYPGRRPGAEPVARIRDAGRDLAHLRDPQGEYGRPDLPRFS